MAEPRDLVVVSADGSVRVAGRAAERRLRDQAGRYRMVMDLPGLIVLRNERPDGDDAGQARVLMTGEIVTRMTVMEIINVIANANWRGEFHVMTGDLHRVMAFDQGALKNAKSNAPDDRLGEVLFRMGILSREQLDALLRDIGPERRLGELLVEQGIADQGKLFEYLQKQAEQIFFNALLVGEGHYLFRLPNESEAPPSATLHIPIQQLLMEGVQRVDEMALFRQRIPNAKLCPVHKPDAPDKKLEPTAASLLTYCNGDHSIEDISRMTGLGEFESTKAIYQLVQQGQVVLRSSMHVDEEVVRRLLSDFNDVMRDIFMAVATYGRIDQTREKLIKWMGDSGRGRFLGPAVEEDGSLSLEQVMRALASVEHEHPLEGAHQALHELAAFALFSASSALPRDQELALARDVNRRLKTIRI